MFYDRDAVRITDRWFTDGRHRYPINGLHYPRTTYVLSGPAVRRPVTIPVPPLLFASVLGPVLPGPITAVMNTAIVSVALIRGISTFRRCRVHILLADFN